MENEKEILRLSRVGDEEDIKNQALQICLHGVKYPATRRQLVRYARKRCPDEITDSIRHTDRFVFSSMTEVEGAVL